MRFAFVVVVFASLAGRSPACTFCVDGAAGRVPLAQHLAGAKWVAFGQLKNPRPAADGVGGTTEFHVARTLKTAGGVAPAAVVTVPRYVPVIGDTPPDYLLFCTLTDGKLDPVHGVPAGSAAAEYLAAAVALDRSDSKVALGFFFRHLDSNDAVVSADAFTEFARAPDTTIAAAAGTLDRVKLRTWLADPKTPEDRLGVYAMMLGLCGTPADAGWLTATLTPTPLPDRLASNLGGYLAGLTTLDPDAGWKKTGEVLSDPARPFTEKLAAVGVLRYFQTTRERETKPRVLAGMKTLILAGDLADVAADDLRRWAWWDLSAELFTAFDGPSAPAVRRAVVRYALACPDETAKAFVERVRAKDPKLVQKVIDAQKAFEKK